MNLTPLLDYAFKLGSLGGLLSGTNTIVQWINARRNRFRIETKAWKDQLWVKIGYLPNDRASGMAAIITSKVQGVVVLPMQRSVEMIQGYGPQIQTDIKSILTSQSIRVDMNHLSLDEDGWFFGEFMLARADKLSVLDGDIVVDIRPHKGRRLARFRRQVSPNS